MSARAKPDVQLVSAQQRLLNACDEIIELKNKLEAAQKDNAKLRAMYALKQNDVEDLIEERGALEHALAVKHDDLEDAKVVEAFWRACAEQALRLWERVQDENDELNEKYNHVLARFGKCER